MSNCQWTERETEAQGGSLRIIAQSPVMSSPMAAETFLARDSLPVPDPPLPSDYFLGHPEIVPEIVNFLSPVAVSHVCLFHVEIGTGTLGIYGGLGGSVCPQLK